MIDPMEPRDKEPVLGLVRATSMFTAAEIAVAEELIDIYLGKSGQKRSPGAVGDRERPERRRGLHDVGANAGRRGRL